MKIESKENNNGLLEVKENKVCLVVNNGVSIRNSNNDLLIQSMNNVMREVRKISDRNIRSKFIKLWLEEAENI